MRIGFPNNPRRDLMQEIEWIGRNGFDFVDLFLEEDKAVPERIDTGKVGKLLRKYRLGVVGHTAWYLPIGSPARGLREAAVKEAVRYFRAFSELGVRFVTVHANWPGGMFSEREGIRFQAWSLRRLVREADAFGLRVMYEPLDGPYDSEKNVAEILRRVPGLFLHIDIGHANLFGRRPERFIRRFGSRLKHIHLHDNNGERDLHLPMGCGSIEWESVVETLKRCYDGTVTLEVFSRDREYALLARDKLKSMWKKA